MLNTIKAISIAGTATITISVCENFLIIIILKVLKSILEIL